MALQYNYGICTNMDREDGNPCPLCASKEKQKILSTRDFVCRECGEPLTKVNGPGGGSDWVKYACIGVGAVAVLGGGGFGIYKAISPSQPKEVSLNHTEKTLYVGDKDTLVANILPEKCEGTLVWKVSKGGGVVVNDGIVTAVKAGEGKVQVTIEGVDGVEAICKYTIKPKDNVEPEPKKDSIEIKRDSIEKVIEKPIDDKKNPAKPESKGTSTPMNPKPPTPKPCPRNPQSGNNNLGYGTFSGPIKNRQPNGRGTLRYKASHLIDSRDPKGRVALPGDYVIGEWKNGKLIQGTWFDSSNNSKGSIIIGL